MVSDRWLYASEQHRRYHMATHFFPEFDPRQNKFYPASRPWDSQDQEFHDDITKEADGSCKLELAVPGYNREHVSLSVKEKQLVVNLQKPNSKRKYTKTYHIGDSVDISAITATCKDGMITVLLPLKTSEQPRTIPVN